MAACLFQLPTVGRFVSHSLVAQLRSVLWSLAVCSLAASPSAAALPPIFDLLPADTQGVIAVRDLPQFVDQWNATQVGMLGNDERLQPFWDSQRDQISNRFAAAGWQLNLKPGELLDISSGQAAAAWISQSTSTRHPYGVCLVVEVDHAKRAQAQALLAKVDRELKQRGATAENVQVVGQEVHQYTLPRANGEAVIRSVCYVLADDALFATDDLTLLSSLLKSATAGRAEQPLSADPVYTAAAAKLGEGQRDLRYFVRPLGLARAIRSIAARPATNQTDVIKILENQGFGSLAGVAGAITVGGVEYDIEHDAFVLLQQPVSETVKILDFPNIAADEVPAWVPPQAASTASFAWDANEAFWRVEPIFDEIAGGEGTFDNVIESIQEDPLGPQINLRTEVLPFFTGRYFLATDTQQPISVESRRTAVAIEIDDAEGKLAAAVTRAMENEPDAIPEDYRGVRIFRVDRSANAAELDIDTDFGNFGTGNGNFGQPEEESQPLLEHWAITTTDGYLLFSSHVEMLQLIIDRLKDQPDDLFRNEADVQRVLEHLDLSQEEHSAWRIVRADRSFEMQYELFRLGQLEQSQSILATLLDRVLRTRDMPAEEPIVKGDRLPAFDQIRDYLMPMGYKAVSTEDGWSMKIFMLGKPR